MFNGDDIDQDTLKILAPWFELSKMLAEGPFEQIPKVDEKLVTEFMKQAGFKQELKLLYLDSPVELLIATHYLESIGITFQRPIFEKYKEYYNGIERGIEAYITSFVKANQLNFDHSPYNYSDFYWRHYLIEDISQILSFEEHEAGDGQAFRINEEENPDLNDSEENRVQIINKVHNQLPFLPDNPEVVQNFMTQKIHFRASVPGDFLVNTYVLIPSAAKADVFLNRYGDTMDNDSKSMFQQFIAYSKNPIFEMYFLTDDNSEIIYILISQFPKRTVYKYKENIPVGLHNEEGIALEFADGWVCHFINYYYFSKYQFDNFIKKQPSEDEVNKMDHLEQHDTILEVLRDYYNYSPMPKIGIEQIRKWFSSEDAEFWYTINDMSGIAFTEEEWENYQ